MEPALTAENIQWLLNTIQQQEPADTIHAQARLYLLHYESVTQSLRMPGNLEGHGREDLVHDAFFQSIATLRAGKLRDATAFRNHWQETARNRIKNLRRQNRQRGGNRDKLFQRFYDDTPEDGEQLLIERELFDLVQQLLNMLSERCRQILRLYFSPSSSAEIAVEMGYASAGSVDVTKLRCLNRLRKIVANRNIKDPRQ